MGRAAGLSPNGTKISRRSLPPGDTTQGDTTVERLNWGRLRLVRFRRRVGENGLFVPIHFGLPVDVGIFHHSRRQVEKRGKRQPDNTGVDK